VVRFKDVVLIKKTLGHLVFPNAILVRTNKQKVRRSVVATSS
jgi:hypothetical protein